MKGADLESVFNGKLLHPRTDSLIHAVYYIKLTFCSEVRNDQSVALVLAIHSLQLLLRGFLLPLTLCGFEYNSKI